MSCKIDNAAAEVTVEESPGCIRDGESYLWSNALNRGFSNWEEVLDAAFYENCDIRSLDLEECDPIFANRKIFSPWDYFGDVMDDTMNPYIEEAFDILNTALDEIKEPIAYEPNGKKVIDKMIYFSQ